MRNSAWSTQITVALIIASLAPSLHARSMELTPTAGDARWMNKGVWTARLRNRQVLPDTIRRLGPKGSPHNLAVMRWPDGEPNLPVQLKPGEWLHGPFWTADGRHVLAHGYLMGVPLTRLYLVDVKSGQARLFSMPGFIRWGHGSWDCAQTVMAFDGERDGRDP
jgi:hypothetical protein